MAAVQFYGAGAVIKAAENRDCARWAIFSGKQFLFKYEGDDITQGLDLLTQTLNAISHSAATYTIKFYEGEGKINEKTICDGGSFNFRMVDEEERASRYQTYNATSNAVLKKLEEMDQRLQAMEADDDDGEEMGGIGGIITGLLKEPEKLGALINIGKNLLGLGPKYPAAPAAINGVPASGEERILAALQILQETDPKLPEHLEKLAAISQSDPGTFKMLTGMLDKM